ncbi:MAG TPA: ATP-binding protein [Polyangiaceae bacterium]|nr:ATP-binding protein [Polyangiaceae bacterium]
MTATPERSILDWASAGAPIQGEIESGDLAIVAPFPDGVLVGLIDGLGHGPEAAEAARTAAALLRKHPDERPAHLVQRCHDGLRKTRGVCMSIASIDARQSLISWTGVGNVEGILVRQHPARAVEALPVRGGVVGYQVPALRCDVLPIARGDTLIFATDGIRGGFKLSPAISNSVELAADSILDGYGKSTDDACVLVARYVAFPQIDLPIRDESDIAIARRHVRERAYQALFREAAVEALATAVTEIASNIVVHAATGRLCITLVEDGSRSGLVVTATDEGPGIADVERAMQDHYSTGRGLGLGLPSARRLVDEFDVASTVGGGTVVTLKVWRT